MIEIAWSDFTPYRAMAGGVLIGLSAAGLILLNGNGINGSFGRSATSWALPLQVQD